MLSEIRLEFFKCFKKLVLPVRPLTLLTGANASGKSTVIQSLTLLHQTAVDTSWGPKLVLDGSVLSLGTLGDVVDKVNGRRQFMIGLSGAGVNCDWTFESEKADRRDIAVPVARLSWSDPHQRREFLAGDALDALLPSQLNSATSSWIKAALEKLTYIGAERMGPRETYPLGDPSQHMTVGPNGEFTPGMLHWFGDDLDSPVHPTLRLNDAPTLYKQSQAWLDHFFLGSAFDVQPVQRANRVTLGLRTSPETDFHRPQNVGFGLTHILPIVVAGLHAKQGDIVIVENPEVHLHPMGQAKMGLFLARVAASGVSVVLETHSDHILNGVRRAVRGNLIHKDQVAIHFFQPRAAAETPESAQVISPSIDGNGNIDRWPEGFFDQFDKDMSYFSGFGE